MLTPQQEEAFKRAYQILSEQFDGVLLAVVANMDSDIPQEATRAAWYGGRVQAMGLAEEVRERLKNVGRDLPEGA